MKRWLLALSLLSLTAAGRAWDWGIPSDVPPPVVPADNAMSVAKVELGRRLFYDADLSANGTLSCAGCHEQKRAFTDGNATRPGVHGDPGKRNIPGLANVAWRTRLTFADPSLTTLEAQMLVPLLGDDPVELGMKGKEAELTRRLESDACYRRMFRRAFPEAKGAVNLDTISRALAAFERTMISLDSPYDRHRRGDGSALSADARKGAALFAARGCVACHAGQDFTDDRYHRLEQGRGKDRGLIEKTGRPDDADRFRTASLRNAAVTGPWWHDGSAATLEEAIRRHGGEWGPDEMAPLRAFLESLTDRAFLADLRFAMPDRVCGRKL
ncbi:MAG: cytochrome c peroxidase [Sphingobium sp.]